MAAANAKSYSHFRSLFLAKLNIFLGYNTAILLLGVYSNELKTYVYTKAYTWMFIGVLFIIAKTRKQPRCPSIGEWTNIQWYIHTVEYYSMIQINGVSSHKKTWSNFESILLSEEIQSGKPTCCMNPTVWHSGKSKTMETVNKSVASGSDGGRKGKNRWSTGDF